MCVRFYFFFIKPFVLNLLQELFVDKFPGRKFLHHHGLTRSIDSACHLIPCTVCRCVFDIVVSLNVGSGEEVLGFQFREEQNVLCQVGLPDRPVVCEASLSLTG